MKEGKRYIIEASGLTNKLPQSIILLDFPG